jgi:hypothetical protein
VFVTKKTIRYDSEKVMMAEDGDVELPGDVGIAVAVKNGLTSRVENNVLGEMATDVIVDFGKISKKKMKKKISKSPKPEKRKKEKKKKKEKQRKKGEELPQLLENNYNNNNNDNDNDNDNDNGIINNKDEDVEMFSIRKDFDDTEVKIA